MTTQCKLCGADITTTEYVLIGMCEDCLDKNDENVVDYRLDVDEFEEPFNY